MDQNIAVEVELYGSTPSVAVVRPSGDLDVITAPALRSELSVRIERQQHVILDLGEVTFLGSTGLQVIVEAHHAARERGRVLHITGTARRVIARPLGITGLDGLLDISDAFAAVLAAELLDGESTRVPAAGRAG